jgi:hypothetical protein
MPQNERKGESKNPSATFIHLNNFLNVSPHEPRAKENEKIEKEEKCSQQEMMT